MIGTLIRSAITISSKNRLRKQFSTAFQVILSLHNRFWTQVGDLFTGSITYKNSIMDDVVRLVPMDRFMIETDCPYLPPHPHRGQRNSPLFLHLVAEKIAELKGITPKEVAAASYENAMRFFRVPEPEVKPVKSGRKK